MLTFKDTLRVQTLALQYPVMKSYGLPGTTGDQMKKTQKLTISVHIGRDRRDGSWKVIT